MIVLSKRDRFEVKLDRDADSDQPSIFVFRPMDRQETIEVEDAIGLHRQSGGAPSGTINWKVCKTMVHWQNVMDGDGKEIPFAADANGDVKDELLLMLGPDDRAELAAKAFTHAHLSKEEAKNSG